MKTNKAAMFGLDARIALAILGALSVISGVALYSVIQQAKVTSFASEIIELGKAVEQYTLDTSGGLPVSSASASFKEIYELTSSTKSGWNGPYFRFSDDAGSGVHYARHKNIFGTVSSVTIINRKKDRTSCVDLTDCYVWATFNYIPESYGPNLKNYFDNTDDVSDVGISSVSTQSVGNINFYYRIMPALSL